MASKDAGAENMLFDIEDGDEGDEVNIQGDVDTEVEPVRTASRPSVRSKSIGHLIFLSGHGADGACWVAGEACNTERAPGQ